MKECNARKLPGRALEFPLRNVERSRPHVGRRTLEAGFGPDGTIWSCAIQDYPPPAPAKFDKPYKPYAMAVVDLTDGLRVLGQIKTDDIRSVKPDTKVTLVIDTLYHDNAGNEVVTWKFRPVAG